MKQLIKNNIKIILGFILGLIWSGGIVYASVNGYLFDSDEVSYDNTTSNLTSTNVQDALDELYIESTSYQLFEQKIHPVGSIFMTVNSNYNTAAKVGTALGGTWEAIGQGRVLIGAGTNGTYTFTAGSTGGETVAGNSSSASQTITNPLGEYTHKLVVNEIPSHRHEGIYYVSGAALSWAGNVQAGGSGAISGAGNSSNVYTGNAGSSYYHNNIQPYLVVYMYKRTA